MKFSVVLALAMAGLTMTASAQKLQKPRTKPSHSEEKESGKKTSRAIKEPVSRTNAATELRRVEQSSAKASASKKAESSKAARTNPALKVKEKDSNPPIHLASSGGSGRGGKGKAGDPYKGRLRHKGSHK
jgi:hypothetical protein